MRKINMLGVTYGRLTVIGEAGRISGHLSYICLCECGNQKTVTGPNLRSGITKSCGCLAIEQTRNRSITHGRSKSPTYESWSQMKKRCSDSRNKNYGGRGIKVCERWLSFENFLSDMGERPDDMTIERIDVNGNYEPENCTWATDVEQAKNRRKTIKLTHDGLTLCLKDWAKKLGKPYSTMLLHYNRGHSVDHILGVTQ